MFCTILDRSAFAFLIFHFKGDPPFKTNSHVSFETVTRSQFEFPMFALRIPNFRSSYCSFSPLGFPMVVAHIYDSRSFYDQWLLFLRQNSIPTLLLPTHTLTHPLCPNTSIVSHRVPHNSVMGYFGASVPCGSLNFCVTS